MSTGADQTDDKISWDDIPAERQHELLKLAETLSEEDPENAAKAQASRRELLKGAGALGLGAVLGGASYESFSQPAAASHGGGSVGTSSSPVDVFANTVATETLNNTEYVSSASEFTTKVGRATKLVITENIDLTNDAPVSLPGKLLVTSAQGETVQIKNTSTSSTFQPNSNVAKIRFRDLHLTGDNSAPYHFEAANDGVHEVFFDGVEFDGYSTAAYEMDGQWRIVFRTCTFDGGDSGTTGIEANGNNATGNNQLRILDETDFVSHTSHGVTVNSMGSMTARDASVEGGNGGNGIHIADTANLQGLTVSGIHAESQTGSGVYIGTTGGGTALVSGGKYQSNDIGVELGPNATNVLVVGVSCLSNTTASIKTDGSGSGHTFINCDTDTSPNLNHSEGAEISNSFFNGVRVGGETDNDGGADLLVSDTSGDGASQLTLSASTESFFKWGGSVLQLWVNDGGGLTRTLDISSGDVSFRSSDLRDIQEYSNAAATDLQSQEMAFDTNRGGTGSVALIFKDSSGTLNYWDADGTV